MRTMRSNSQAAGSDSLRLRLEVVIDNSGVGGGSAGCESAPPKVLIF